MKEESDNIQQMAGASGALCHEVCLQRGLSNGKEFRMTVSNKGKRSLMREGYMYRLDHSGKDKLSWRCSTRGCPAHLKTNHVADIIVQDNEKSHTHTVDAHRFEKQMLRVACKRKAIEDCSSRTQDIISSEMTRICGHNLSPKNTKFLQLAMYRERKKIFPALPRVFPSGKTHKHNRDINIPSDNATNIPTDVVNNIPTDVANNIPTDVVNNIPTHVANNIPTDVANNIPTDVAKNIPTDVAQNIPTDVANNIPSDVVNNIHSGVANNIHSDVANNIHSGVANNIHEPHHATLPTAVVYSRASCLTYEPHFDLLTEVAGSGFHHPRQLYQPDQCTSPHLHHQPSQSAAAHLHHQQLLHHQLQSSGSPLSQTLFPSSHLLPRPLVIALATDRETGGGIQSSHCETQAGINFETVKVHEGLLLDKVRTLTYRRALQENRERLKGATLLHVGAGTGILSHFAVQAGAARVYAVEPTGMAAFADRVAKENGVGSVISVIQSSIEAADIPVKVDAIICEWMGDSLLCQAVLPSLLTARDKYLRQGGDMYPCTATLYLAPITDMDCQDRFTSWKQMKNLYGVSMESVVALARDAFTVQAITGRHLEGESVLANACQVAHFDLKTMLIKDAQLITADFSFRCYSLNTMHGFATWFLAYFPGTVVLDTSPYALKTHWGQTGLYLKLPVSVQQDSEIKGVFMMQPSAESLSSWDIQIDFQLNRGRKFSQQWQCVTPR